MNSFATNLLLSALVIFIYMSLWALWSIWKKRSDMADQAWGLGFVLVAILQFLFSGSRGNLLIILFLVSIWGWRLFWHINRRQIKSEEDPRYQYLVDKKKSRFREVYLKVFMLQGLFMLIVSMPITVAGFYGSGWERFGWVNILGLGGWIVGFLFESIADKQLKDFLSDSKNKGKIMTRGLWNYSRHPNYFGEIVMWWSIFILSYPGELNPIWLSAIVGPLLITYLIVFVSGIPLVESRYLEREDYKKYAINTSVLIPWFKK